MVSVISFGIFGMNRCSLFFNDHSHDFGNFWHAWKCTHPQVKQNIDRCPWRLQGCVLSGGWVCLSAATFNFPTHFVWTGPSGNCQREIYMYIIWCFLCGTGLHFSHVERALLFTQSWHSWLQLQQPWVDSATKSLPLETYLLNKDRRDKAILSSITLQTSQFDRNVNIATRMEEEACPADDWNTCFTVCSDSLPSIMAVSFSSPCLLLMLLLISSPSWVSNRGSAFLMDRDGTTSSGKSPPSLHRQKNRDWSLSADPSAHQTLTSAVHKHLVDIGYHVLCQTCRKCCAQAHVEMFTVEQTPRVPSSSNRLIDKAGVNIWSEVFLPKSRAGMMQEIQTADSALTEPPQVYVKELRGRREHLTFIYLLKPLETMSSREKSMKKRIKSGPFTEGCSEEKMCQDICLPLVYV